MIQKERNRMDLPKLKKLHLEGYGNICNCCCHVDEVDVFCSCFTQCCNRVGTKYYDIEGNFDVHRFVKKIHDERIELRTLSKKKRKTMKRR